ncbi:hypothetical protein RUM43_003504 [Polyplax serrata]|uniref:Uncharacterized protein n=1 Tax=Polyplax serrata TaxID=468196 RepID=A0AAN8P2E0_POLSC
MPPGYLICQPANRMTPSSIKKSVDCREMFLLEKERERGQRHLAIALLRRQKYTLSAQDEVRNFQVCFTPEKLPLNYTAAMLNSCTFAPPTNPSERRGSPLSIMLKVTLKIKLIPGQEEKQKILARRQRKGLARFGRFSRRRQKISKKVCNLNEKKTGA